MFNWLKRQISNKSQTQSKPQETVPPQTAAAISQKDKAQKKYAHYYIGKIIHYYPKIQVGIIKIEKGALQLGDTIYIQGHQTRFKQPVTSIEYEHQKVKKAPVGYEVGVRVGAAVREGDDVYVLPQAA